MVVAEAPLGTKSSCEAGQAWSRLLLRKKGRGQVREWSHMLQEIMNRSRQAGGDLALSCFLSVFIFKNPAPATLGSQTATLSAAF